MARQNMNELERVMKQYGAIPTDWQHFFEDVAPYIKEENGSSYNKQSTPCPHENTEWNEVKLCTDCGEIIDQCT